MKIYFAEKDSQFTRETWNEAVHGGTFDAHIQACNDYRAEMDRWPYSGSNFMTTGLVLSIVAPFFLLAVSIVILSEMVR